MYRALIVDDDPQVCALTTRALANYRFDCEMANDGEEALFAYRRSRFDAVVTDLRMPRRHGHSLAVELLSATPRPKIVVLTGLIQPQLARDLAQRGVEEVVQKPVNYDHLAQRVLQVVTGSPATGLTAARPKGLLATIEESLIELTGFFTDRLSGLFDDLEGLSDPPAAVKNFIERQEELEAIADAEPLQNWGGHEAREKTRARCAASAVAIPVNAHFEPTGEPFKLAIRDVSESGLRLLHTRATNAEFLALNWGAVSRPFEQLCVVAKVMRCRPLSPFYDIGGQFVMAD